MQNGSVNIIDMKVSWCHFSQTLKEKIAYVNEELKDIAIEGFGQIHFIYSHSVVHDWETAVRCFHQIVESVKNAHANHYFALLNRTCL